MWHKPRVLPRVSFGVVIIPVSRGERGEGCFPVPVGKFCPHESGGGVEYVFIVFRSFYEEQVIVFFVQGFGHLSHAPVVVSVFEGFGNRFFFQVAGYVIVGSEEAQPVSSRQRGFFHGFIGFFDIEVPNAFQVCFRDDGYGVIPDHAIRFIPHEFPSRE